MKICFFWSRKKTLLQNVFEFSEKVVFSFPGDQMILAVFFLPKKAVQFSPKVIGKLPI